MNLTTENIIKMLSKNESATKILLERFNSLNDDERFEVSNKIWDLYDLMYEGRLQVNVQKALNEVAANKKELSSDFYKKVKEETDKEVEKEFFADTTSADINSVRDKISKIIGNPAT